MLTSEDVTLMYPNYKKPFDLTTDEQPEIVITEHNSAHRAAQENTKQILQDYYFPKMTNNQRSCEKL